MSIEAKLTVVKRTMRITKVVPASLETEYLRPLAFSSGVTRIGGDVSGGKIGLIDAVRSAPERIRETHLLELRRIIFAAEGGYQNVTRENPTLKDNPTIYTVRDPDAKEVAIEFAESLNHIIAQYARGNDLLFRRKPLRVTIEQGNKGIIHNTIDYINFHEDTNRRHYDNS